MIKKKKTMHITQEVLIIFVWMIVALAWDWAINWLIDAIRHLFPFTWIVISFLYAIFLTIASITLVVFLLDKVDTTDNKEENNYIENDTENNNK